MAKAHYLKAERIFRSLFKVARGLRNRDIRGGLEEGEGVLTNSGVPILLILRAELVLHDEELDDTCRLPVDDLEIFSARINLSSIILSRLNKAASFSEIVLKIIQLTYHFNV